MLLASDIHDNPGAGLALRANASPRITHNTFSSNGASEQASSAMLIETGAQPVFVGNFFHNLDPQSFAGLDVAARLQLQNVNWFPGAEGRGVGEGREGPEDETGAVDAGPVNRAAEAAEADDADGLRPDRPLRHPARHRSGRDGVGVPCARHTSSRSSS